MGRIENVGVESEFLSKQEVRDLTGRVVRDLQDEKLRDLGVPFIRDKDRIIVSRFHVREWLSGKVHFLIRGPEAGSGALGKRFVRLVLGTEHCGMNVRPTILRSIESQLAELEFAGGRKREHQIEFSLLHVDAPL
ncbi:MAG: DUF4224 domain-containing protein [Pseudomonadota bacterium]|nr:DUF4224 domain-containing protein [Pseudomonadota bacterium]